MPGERPAPGAAEDPRRRPREQGLYRVAGDHRRGRDATVGAHDVQLGGEPLLAETAFKPGDIVTQPRPDKGVEQRGGESLEFAELRRHLGRAADEDFGRLLAHDVARARLVRRVEVGEQEADGYRLDTVVAQRASGLAHPRLVERDQHVAAWRNEALRHRSAVPPAGQRPVLPWHLLADRIMLRPLVAPDMDDIAIALRGDHPGDCAVML